MRGPRVIVPVDVNEQISQVQETPELVLRGNYYLAGGGTRRSAAIRTGRGGRTRPQYLFRRTRGADLRVGESTAVAWPHSVPFKFTARSAR